MRSKIVLSFLLTTLFVLASGCGTTKNCPVCGTTTAGQYTVIDVVPVPEHNPTGEPGGPFNSFDISWVDPVNHRFYVSDRIGLDVPIFDTLTDIALFSIGGANVVSTGGNPSPCDPNVPPLMTAVDPTTKFNVFTRFGCRTGSFVLPGGFGPNGLFGGWAGAQCCASRSNGVNPISCPCGEVITADGNFFIVGNSSSSVTVFDMRQTLADITAGKTLLDITPPTVIADFPTGTSPDFDGPNGVAPCIVAWTGRAGSDPTCGDDRADEMSFDDKTKVLMVDNGDPGMPFVTLVDLSGVINGALSGTGTLTQQHCLPVDAATGAPLPALTPYTSTNRPSCIIGQIYYDGGVLNAQGTDPTGLPCPDPSSGFSDLSPVPSGIPGVPCIHAPIAPAGLGGSVFNPNSGFFLTANPNNQGDPRFGDLDVVDPAAMRACSTTAASCPVIVSQFQFQNCMPGGAVQGPGNDFLVGCIDHDGMAFPPNAFIVDGTSGQLLASFDQVGGMDETWYNPGDGRYYLAARDMPGGPVMGVIDGKTRTWLANAPTGSNSHSISAEPANNHIFVPLQAGGRCLTQSTAGCIGVYAQE
jgi:hypothetical protein